MQPPRKRQRRFRVPAGAPISSGLSLDQAFAIALLAQSVERRLGMSEVAGSKPAESTMISRFAPVAQRQRQHAQTVPSASSNLARRTSLRALRALRRGKPSHARRLPRRSRGAETGHFLCCSESHALSSEAERRSHAPKVEISKLSARTNTASLAQWQSAAATWPR